MSLLTVVTVVKDDDFGLHRTLASLKSQDSQDFSVLVVDGSTDRVSVPKILSGFGELSPSYRWAEPSGVYQAMNDALDDVTTPYTYFLNAGDELAGHDVLGRVSRQLEAEAPLWAFGRVLFFNEKGQALPEPDWSYSEERQRLFARGLFPAHQGVVVKTTELREQGGFDTQFRVAADYASILKCALKAAPLELGFPLAIFKQGGLSTTEWRLSLREFHQARVSVFRPSGSAAVRERLNTLTVQLRTHAFHILQGLRSDRPRFEGDVDPVTKQ